MNIIFFGPNGSVVRWAYTDVIESNEVEYCECPTFRPITEKYILSNTASKIMPNFVKKILYRKLLKYNFLKKLDKKREYLFVFTCQNNLFFIPFFFVFVKFLRKNLPKAKFAFYYYDLVRTCMPEKVDEVKEIFDIVYTFDKGDAKNYGLTFYGELCAKNELVKSEDKEYDFLYIGTDRGRLKNILSIFNKLSSYGYSCNFFVDKVLSENLDFIKSEYKDTLTQLEEDNQGKIEYNGSVLTYNVYVPYVHTLKYINKCKAMVEIVLSGQTAGTMRLPEACIYEKKLLSNCQTIKSRDVFNSNNMFIFDSVEDITKTVIDDLLEAKFVECEHNFSAIKLIEETKEILFKGNEK